MKCPKCTFENSDTQHFCGQCGSPLAAPPPFSPGSPEHTRTQVLRPDGLKTGAIFAGRYQVIEELGTGGMGCVYRVFDAKLDEEIALKVLRHDIGRDHKALERFRSELKTARQVVHRNVARMYDLNEADGVPYITMEYVRGENLRRLINKVGRLDAGQVIPIASQVCLGLAEAHRLGIVHRDLKPQNIMIDEDAKAQILDFGLARLVSSSERAETGAGEGTPAYVSPEQIEGRAVDRRSDIYSLGAVLYEMVTGHPPFRAETRGALAMKHLTETPQDPRESNPEIPPGLSKVILKCLEKKPEMRHQSAQEVLAELGRLEQELSTGKITAPDVIDPTGGTKSPRIGKWVLRGIAILAAVTAIGFGIYWGFIRTDSPFRPSIAVLMEKGTGADDELGNRPLYLQKNTIGKLASIPRLRVIPWEMVSGYEGDNRNDRKIGKELGAKYLLRMNIREVDAKYRLTANLIEASRGDILQSYNLDHPQSEYFQLEDEIPPLIARALRVHLVEERLRRIKRREPKNLGAYDRYLDGMAALSEGADFTAAIGHFKEAIKIDPHYALAYWGLGNSYEGRYNSNVPAESGKPEDLDLMNRAYRLAFDYGPNSPETNLGIGWVYFYEGDNVKAAERFSRALEIDPGSVMVNRDAGAFLRSLGLYDRAIKYLRRASRLNPLDPEPFGQRAQCHMYMGRFKRACALMKEATIKAPGDRNMLIYYAVFLAVSGRLEEAERVLMGVDKIEPKRPKPAIALALLAAARGEKKEALRHMEESTLLTLEATCVFILLGMEDEAIHNIEASIERGFAERGAYLHTYPCLAKSSLFDGLRDDPRFQDILKKQKIHYRQELKNIGKL